MSWETYKKELPTVTLKVTTTETEEEHQIKLILMRKMMSKLIDYMHITKSHNFADPFNPYEYSAELTVADRNITGVTIDEEMFLYQNQKFSNEKIQKALKNTYPEYFL